MSLRRLHRLLPLIEHGAPDLHTWLAEALDDYRAGLPLEQALGISGPKAIKARNSALRRAARYLDPDEQHSTWARAERVARALRRLDRCATRYRDGGSPLRQTLVRILEVEAGEGVRPVRSQRAIYELIRD